MKTTVPLLITACVGILLVIAYFVPYFDRYADAATLHFNILAFFAFVLGGANLLHSHARKIAGQRPGWAYSAITVGAFAITLIVGLGKVGVTPRPGYQTDILRGGGGAVAYAQLRQRDGESRLDVRIYGGAANAEVPVVLGGRRIGMMALDAEGRTRRTITVPGEVAAQLEAQGSQPVPLELGGLVSGSLVAHSRFTGAFNQDGAAFQFIYQYAYLPLHATMFALLAFFIASASFRAFRAKNTEAVVLLVAATVILLGRTVLGSWLTGWLPSEGLLGRICSFFHLPNLSEWIMQELNKAGNRAIMIGVALGVAATSIKILLGIDRPYIEQRK